MSDESVDDNGETPEPVAETEPAGATARRGGIGILALIVISLSWYLVADRYAPYTDQARIQGYVIGIAPEVAGRITEVDVANNQEVDAGQP
ncbi:MAG: biotin/lipoyl-binding protein, partial [Pseudomonadota bacterium]